MNLLVEFLSKDFEISLQGSETKLSSLKNKTVLITGGTGFMGSWLSYLIVYLNQNYNYNITLFLVSRELDVKITEPLLKKFSYIHFIRHDIRNYFELPHEVNYIFHAAASPDTRFHASQPLRTIETIVNGSTNVFQAATRLPDLQNIVHVSSGLVYGKNETGTYQEEVSFGKLDCSQLTAVYSESKRLSETIAIGYKNQFRLPLSIVRPFTFIGAFQNLDKPWAFNSLLREALLKQPLRILGNGDVTRGYMYGSDMSVWLLSTLANAQPGSIYNIGSNDPINLKNLSDIILSKLEHESKIEFGQYTLLQNNFHWVADTTKIQRELAVAQKISINNAINRTIEFYKKFDL